MIVCDLKENIGVGKARDLAIGKATGKYVMFVDPDDWIEPETVGECVKAIEANNADLVEFGYQRRHSFDYEKTDIPLRYQIYDNPEAIESATEHISCNKMYILDLIRKNKIEFRHRIFEDTLFTRRYSICCRKAVFINKIFYNYYVNPSSLTSTMNIARLQQNDRTEEVVRFYESHNLIRQKKNYIKASLLFLIRQLMPMSRTEHERFEFSSPSGCFAKSCEKYIDRFNRSGLLFRLSAYRLLGVRSSVKSILKHGL